MRASSTSLERSVSLLSSFTSREKYKSSVLTVAVGAIVKEARARAGPEDAKLMVGKDFGGLRVVN
jgi:hypothetical protein